MKKIVLNMVPTRVPTRNLQIPSSAQCYWATETTVLLCKKMPKSIVKVTLLQILVSSKSWSIVAPQWWWHLTEWKWWIVLQHVHILAYHLSHINYNGTICIEIDKAWQNIGLGCKSFSTSHTIYDWIYLKLTRNIQLV